MINQLYIQVDGRALDLAPGTVLEVEEQNPFLQMSDELQGDYSLPVDIPLTDNNKIAFKHIQLLPSANKLQQIDNVIAGDSMEQFAGILKKEQVEGNLNHAGTDKLSMYLLKGWSHFYNDVKGKTLQDADYGGNRDLGAAQPPFTIGTNVIDYCNQVMRTGTIDAYDFAVFPVYNSLIGKAIEYKNILNYVVVKSSQPELYVNMLSLILKRPPILSLFPYLNYVLKRLFEHVGWQVDGFIFNDPDWRKAVILNSQYLNPSIVNNRSLVNLKDHIPPMKISSFLIALKNRFGWWYDFDYQKKICVIRKISEIFSGARRKDLTRFCNTGYTVKIPPEKKVYGLNASNADGLDISSWGFQKSVVSGADLPAATAALLDAIYFVAGENRYYICQLKEDSDESEYEWAVLSENDFGYLPPGKTDDITTSCLIPVTRVVNYSTDPGTSIPAFIRGKIAIPEVAMAEDNSDTEQIYVCFHHGLQNDVPQNNFAIVKYPYGSASNRDMQSQKLAGFAMTYRFYPPGNPPFTDEGLYESFWKNFLSRLDQAETIEITARMPQRLAMELRWQDTVLINNVEYIIVKKLRTVPYGDQIKLTLARI